MKRGIELLVIFLLLSCLLKAQDKYTISGYVKDAGNGEALIGATVFTSEKMKGTASNVYGYYSLTLPEGKYTINYSYLGYETIKDTIFLNKDIKKNVELKSSAKNLEAVEVTAERQDENIASTEMSVNKIEVETIKKLPSFMGEVDVLKTVQLLPGVQSGGEGSTGFFVRGGSADQNLILLDEATVYNASHLFNFFSVFNPDAVKDLKLYKGGIPARYGGRLSSVLDIRMKEGNTKEFHGAGGIGLISSRLTLEGPIVKDKSSFLITGRRTYADLFLKLSNDESLRNNKLYFYDLNTKLNYTINDNNRLFLSGYFGRDVTGFEDVFGFDWGNATGTLRWNHLFSDKLFSNFSLVYTNYEFNIKGDVGPISFRWKSFIDDLNLKADFTYFPNSKNTIRYGAQSTYRNIDPGTIKAEIEESFSSTVELSEKNGLEHAVYASNDQKINELLKLNYGLRASLFQHIGPGKDYIFDKSNVFQYEVMDTVNVEEWKTDTMFYGLEPRLSIRYKLDEFSSVKVGYNRMFQYVQQSQSAQSVAPYDVWYVANKNVPPQIADQVAGGYFRNFNDNMYEASVELYYKWIQNMTDIVDNGDVLGNELLEGELRTGKGWSYGLEFLAKKEKGDLTGWVSYTWSKTKRQIEGINNGEPYFAPYDRRHNLSLIGSYDITDRISVASTWVYSTGKAITLPLGKFNFQGANAPVFAERNSNRLPDYHRLDLSVTLNPKKKEDRRFESSWNFSIYNVYGRKNPFSVSFEEDENNPDKTVTTMFYLPGPLPAITWNFSF